MMLIDFEPGDYVKNPLNKDWGIGQVQSILSLKIFFRVLNAKACIP